MEQLLKNLYEVFKINREIGREKKDKIRKYKQALSKAKEVYKTQGVIDSKTACLLLNCKPTANIISELVSQLILSERTKQRAFALLKECEKKWGEGKYLSHYGLASAIVYISAILEGERRSQKQIIELCDIQIPTLLVYKKKILTTFSFRKLGKVSFDEYRDNSRRGEG